MEMEEDEVALKIIDIEGALHAQCTDSSGRLRYLQRVLAETKALSQLQHENVVKFYEAFLWPPSYVVFATEFLPGGSLRDLYKSAGPLPEHIIAHLLKYAACCCCC